MRPPWPRCNARPSPGLSTKTPKSAVVAPKTRTSRRRGRREGLGRLRARRCPARGFRSDRSAVRAACTSVLRQEVRENAHLLSFGPYSSTGGPLYRRQVASPTAHIDRDAVLTALRVGSNPSRNSDPDPWETALLRYVLPSRSSRKPARRERRQSRASRVGSLRPRNKMELFRGGSRATTESAGFPVEPRANCSRNASLGRCRTTARRKDPGYES